ncbi:hypothetical protein [Asticcacaulis solisilvae]|uniref:hypothetical protein n=1 Tax=Asticcacaulis solisilvae TaxID=1217274 RepID=UPI003FD82306
MTRTGLIAYIIAFAVAVALFAANALGLFKDIPHGFQIAVVVFAVVWVAARIVLGRMGHLKGGRGRTRPDQ